MDPLLAPLRFGQFWITWAGRLTETQLRLLAAGGRAIQAMRPAPVRLQAPLIPRETKNDVMPVAQINVAPLAALSAEVAPGTAPEARLVAEPAPVARLVEEAAPAARQRARRKPSVPPGLPGEAATPAAAKPRGKPAPRP